MERLVGPESGTGAAFLRKLASATGGTFQSKRLPELAQSITGLLTGKVAA